MVGILLVVLVVLISLATPEERSQITIELEGTSNSISGPVTVLRLSNTGRISVRMNSYCTIYWTNASGVRTKVFFKHNLGNAVLHPGKSAAVAMTVPPEAKIWKSSFSRTIEPGIVRHIWNSISFYLPGGWTPDNSFIGQFGPLVTNAEYFDICVTNRLQPVKLMSGSIDK